MHARAEDFPSQSWVADEMTAKKGSIPRCDGEPSKERGETEMPVKKEREGHGASTQMQEQIDDDPL